MELNKILDWLKEELDVSDPDASDGCVQYFDVPRNILEGAYEYLWQYEDLRES